MTEIKKAQLWLKNKYENKTEEVKEVAFKDLISGDDEKITKLEGEIIISSIDIPSLANIKRIDLFKAEGITKLNIEDCPEITEINVYGNPELAEIVGLENLLNLTKLNCGNTQIEEINVSENTGLEELYFTKNTRTKITGFNKVVKNLVNWSSFNGIPFPWEQIPEEYLKEIAKELGIKEEDIKDKTVDEVKEIIKDKAKQFQENEEKIKTELPDLIDGEGQIDDNKLDELKGLDNNKEDVIEKIKKLELKNKILEKEIEEIKGKERVEELLAQIEVPTNEIH